MKKDWKISFLDQFGEAQFRAGLREGLADLAIEGLSVSDDDCEHIVELAKHAHDEDQMIELMKKWTLNESGQKPQMS